MHIAVLFNGRLTKCAEHYNNIVDSIEKIYNIDFSYRLTIHLLHN